MSKTILVTDSLFIFPEHEKMLRQAGYDIARLDKPAATEEELVRAIKGKVAYILGGIEKVTDAVINAADDLKVIVFTGSDWKQFIPGYALATQKDIAIANAPGANSYAVAEYTVALMLAMTRNVFELGRTGKAVFETTSSLKELTIGIVGMGHIGSQVARMLNGLGAKRIVYTSNTRKPEIESATGASFTGLNDLLKMSDIVTIHVPKAQNKNLIDSAKLSLLKDGSLLINCAFVGALEREALLAELKSGRIKAAQDEPFGNEFDALPLGVWFNSNSGTAFNTHEANQKASDMAVESLLNLLSGKNDTNKVN